MTIKEIKELLDLVVEKGFTEFELERSGVRLKLKRDLAAPHDVRFERIYVPDAPPVARLAPPVAAEIAAAPESPAAPAENLHMVKSPIVGTFYESSTPGADPFVHPGDHVTPGKTLCIIEAMKLMNEIEADMEGEIVKCYISNGRPVEYGETLFSIRPHKKK
jgi:acetyl-CoA carboxylase biotin carboxyl carrier protein